MIAEARRLLQGLEALTPAGAITAHGRAIAALPLHPRLAHMVLKGGRDAPKLAVILSERDILMRGAPVDLTLRLKALTGGRGDLPFTANPAALARARQDLKRLRAVGSEVFSAGEMAALAYPDRIGLRRKGDAARYVLSGGKGACLPDDESMARERLIVATDLDGDLSEAKIRLAAPISEAALRALFAAQIETHLLCDWSRRDRSIRPVRQERFGALVLSEQVWNDCPPDRIAAAMCDGLRDLGFGALPLSNHARLWLSRVEWLRGRGADVPDCSPLGLLDDLEGWLAPHLGACRRVDDLKKVDLTSALQARLNWDQAQMLDRLAPAAITAPTGTRLAIDYGMERPGVSVRLQEMFGVTEHPVIGPDRIPVLIELLSPARRPVQTTADLPGFWRSSYTDVRKDMRGRYPKHPWPEDPTLAVPTTRAKPRGQ